MTQATVGAHPAPSEDRTLAILGQNIFVRRLRPAAQSRTEAPTLVFLHDVLGSVSGWRNFPQKLVRATGLPALIYDRQGHGLSSPLRQPRGKDYHEREAGDFLPAILTACHIEQAIPIGHSDGGSIALMFASLFPHLTTKIIAEAAHVYLEDRTIAGIRAGKERFATTALRHRLEKQHGDKAEVLLNAWVEPWLSPEFRDWNMEAFLPRITSPLLLLQGANDEFGTVERVTRMAASVAGPVQQVILPDCGHTPHVEQSARTLEIMRNFITAG